MRQNPPEDRTDGYQMVPVTESKINVNILHACLQQAQDGKCLTGKQLNQSLKYKTELCRNWQAGTCEFQDKCTFAHGPSELRTIINRTAKYKTKYCKQFYEQGFCMYGPRCQFKHQDLQATAPSTRKSSEADSSRLPVFVEIEKKGEDGEHNAYLLP